MTQNCSHAVMSQRVEAPDSLDFFPTPGFATRALCEWLTDTDEPLHNFTVWEPACGAGHMARPLAEYFASVHATDLHDYGFGIAPVDFLWPSSDATQVYDFVITNPPFRLGQQFAVKAVAQAREGAAMLVRTAFLESAARYGGLFRDYAPSDVLQFVERVPMFKGRVDRHGSTATSYAWLVWRRGAEPGTRLHWLAPCRKRLERDEDYDDVPVQAPRAHADP